MIKCIQNRQVGGVLGSSTLEADMADQSVLEHSVLYISQVHLPYFSHL